MYKLVNILAECSEKLIRCRQKAGVSVTIRSGELLECAAQTGNTVKSVIDTD